LKYRLSAKAQEDLEENWLFIAQDDPDAADNFLDAIEARLIMLATHPDLGTKCEELSPELKRFPIGSFVIFFRKKKTHIEIVRILHGARDIEALFNSQG
jgi:toxin ParE1/3/4